MNEWRASTWGEEISLEYGKALRDYDTERGKYRVFGSNGPIGWTDKPLASGPGVILGRKGAYRGIEFSREPFFVIDTAYYVVPKREFDMRWLYYAIKHHKLGEIDDGSPIPSTTRSAVYVRDFDVPPLAEQKAIAAVLGALDDKIELNRRMNATLEAIARALFRSWFVDFDPVRANMDRRGQPSPGLRPPSPSGRGAGGEGAKGLGRRDGDEGRFALDPATAALFPDHLEESPIGKKPVGWEITTLETALSVLEVGGRPKGGVGGITSGIPSIGAESIVGIGQFDFGKTKYVPVEFYEGMKKGHIQSHDVLLYKDGGRPGEYEPHVSMFGDGFPFEKCSINEHVYRLRTNERLSQEYLYFWLTSELALAEMRVKGTGVAIPGLNSTAVRSLTTLVPPKPIVDAFTKQAAPLVTRILANSKQSRTLATLRDTLLPKLLSGELSVANSTE